MTKRAYLVTIVQPFEGLGLQQDPLECTETYTVQMTAKQHATILGRLAELEIENDSEYEYDYDDHYGIVASAVRLLSRAKVPNQLRQLQRFLAWRTPKPNGPEGQLKNKGKEEE